MSSRSGRRRVNIDEMLNDLSTSTASLRVSSAPDSGVPSAQPSSAVGASYSTGAPPLRPSIPHDVSTVSSVPHDGSLTSVVGSSGGGVLAGVSALGRSQNKLKLHMLKSFDDRCLGKVSDWGVCVEVKNTTSDVNGCNCPESHKHKASLPWSPSEDNEILIVPANSRRGPAGVVQACYRANDYSSEALEYFEAVELTPDDWVLELTNPENFMSSSVIKEEKPDLKLGEGEGVGAWESAPRVDLSESFQADDVTLKEPVKFNLDVESDLDDVLDEHRALLNDAKKKFSILAEAVDGVQRLVTIQGNVINQNGQVAKGCVSTILHRVRLLEEFLGDVEDLPPDASSVVVVLQAVLERLEAFRKEVDEEIGSVADDLESTAEKIILKMRELVSSIPISSQVSAPSASPSQGPMDIDTIFIVDGIQSSLGSIFRSLTSLAKEVKTISESSGSVSFKNHSFSDEKAIEVFLIGQKNSHGAGIAGFVDAFGALHFRSGSELKKSEFTSTTISLSDQGYEDREVRVITSCAELKTIPMYYDKSASPKEGTMVTAFNNHEDWFGRDGMDGTGLDILTTISDCMGTHETYVEDHFPEEANELKQFAKDTMQASSIFHTKFQETLRKTFTSLTQFGLQDKKIMQLFSDWLHIICKKLYGFRKRAFSGAQNISSRKRLARHIFVTCQALAYQQEIMDDNFMRHPSLSNSYVRQLTVVLGQLKPNDTKIREMVIKEIEKVFKDQKVVIEGLTKRVGTLEKQQEKHHGRLNTLEDKFKLLEKHHPEMFRAKK